MSRGGGYGKARGDCPAPFFSFLQTLQFASVAQLGCRVQRSTAEIVANRYFTIVPIIMPCIRTDVEIVPVNVIGHMIIIEGVGNDFPALRRHGVGLADEMPVNHAHGDLGRHAPDERIPTCNCCGSVHAVSGICSYRLR